MTKKVVVIFGGSGGIGRALRQRLAGKMIVYATDRTKPLKCDVTKEREVRRVFRSVVKAEGRIDVVINVTVAKLKLRPFAELGSDDYWEDLRTNTLGGINIIKNAVPAMQKTGGLIISFLSKTVGEEGVPPPRMASYLTSKYALRGFIKCAREELKKSRIRLLTVSPSFVETKLIAAFPPKLLELERGKLPGKRFVAPQDIAILVSKIITGPLSRYPEDITI